MVRPHPAKGIIVARGERLNAVAVKIGADPGLFCLVLNRRTASWPNLRARLSQYLGVPESELFFDSDVPSDEAVDLARRSRDAQQLTPTVEDSSAINAVADLLS
jgi:hypothetical protein